MYNVKVKYLFSKLANIYFQSTIERYEFNEIRIAMLSYSVKSHVTETLLYTIRY